jgi:prepilin-type N-terminal cleavage/methylation domain-containing protein
MTANRKCRSRAFTLIEVLLAIVLAGGLVIAANMFLLSMGELWGRGTDDRLFDQHVRGVSRFLDSLVRQAVPSGDNGEVFTMDSPKGYESIANPLLTFELNEAPGICVWPGKPLPRVVVWLNVSRDDGLVLLWKSRTEEDFGDVPPRATPISPFVTLVEYEYYDDGRKEWREEERPIIDAGNKPRLPGRVRLTFQRGTKTVPVSIELPTSGAKVILW